MSPFPPSGGKSRPAGSCRLRGGGREAGACRGLETGRRWPTFHDSCGGLRSQMESLFIDAINFIYEKKHFLPKSKTCPLAMFSSWLRKFKKIKIKKKDCSRAGPCEAEAGRGERLVGGAPAALSPPGSSPARTLRHPHPPALRPPPPQLRTFPCS